MKKTTKISLSLVLVLFAASALIAAPETNQDQELKKEIVKINYINAERAWALISRYKSPRGNVNLLPERSLVIIEDTPEFVDKMLEILRQIDIKPVDLEFMVDLVLASDRESGQVPDLQEYNGGPVVRELKNLLKYENFQKLDTAIVRVQDNDRARQKMGYISRPDSKDENRRNFIHVDLQLEMKPHFIEERNQDEIEVELRLIRDQGGKTSVLFDTTLNMAVGEKTVVGVSKLLGSGRALIMILQARIIT